MTLKCVEGTIRPSANTQTISASGLGVTPVLVIVYTHTESSSGVSFARCEQGSSWFEAPGKSVSSGGQGMLNSYSLTDGGFSMTLPSQVTFLGYTTHIYRAYYLE